jgi:hypothetical protein
MGFPDFPTAIRQGLPVGVFSLGEEAAFFRLPEGKLGGAGLADDLEILVVIDRADAVLEGLALAGPARFVGLKDVLEFGNGTKDGFWSFAFNLEGDSTVTGTVVGLQDALRLAIRRFCSWSILRMAVHCRQQACRLCVPLARNLRTGKLVIGLSRLQSEQIRVVDSVFISLTLSGRAGQSTPAARKVFNRHLPVGRFQEQITPVFPRCQMIFSNAILERCRL